MTKVDNKSKSKSNSNSNSNSNNPTIQQSDEATKQQCNSAAMQRCSDAAMQRCHVLRPARACAAMLLLVASRHSCLFMPYQSAGGTKPVNSVSLGYLGNDGMGMEDGEWGVGMGGIKDGEWKMGNGG